MRQLNRGTRTIALAVGVMFLLASAHPGAQTAPPRTPRTPRQPPPPLFPKHRRGIYKNAQGIDVVDATPQSPPLQTDDPGVPDNGEYEINLLTDADISKGPRAFDLMFVDANYG